MWLSSCCRMLLLSAHTSPQGGLDFLTAWWLGSKCKYLKRDRKRQMLGFSTLFYGLSSCRSYLRRGTETLSLHMTSATEFCDHVLKSPRGKVLTTKELTEPITCTQSGWVIVHRMGCLSLHRSVGATEPVYSRQPWSGTGQERRERQETQRKGG